MSYRALIVRRGMCFFLLLEALHDAAIVSISYNFS